MNRSTEAIITAIRTELSRDHNPKNHRNAVCFRDVITDRDFARLMEKINLLSKYGKVLIHEHEENWMMWVELIPES